MTAWRILPINMAARQHTKIIYPKDKALAENWGKAHLSICLRQASHYHLYML